MTSDNPPDQLSEEWLRGLLGTGYAVYAREILRLRTELAEVIHHRDVEVEFHHRYMGRAMDAEAANHQLKKGMASAEALRSYALDELDAYRSEVAEMDKEMADIARQASISCGECPGCSSFDCSGVSLLRAAIRELDAACKQRNATKIELTAEIERLKAAEANAQAMGRQAQDERDRLKGTLLDCQHKVKRLTEKVAMLAPDDPWLNKPLTSEEKAATDLAGKKIQQWPGESPAFLVAHALDDVGDTLVTLTNTGDGSLWRNAVRNAVRSLRDAVQACAEVRR